MVAVHALAAGALEVIGQARRLSTQLFLTQLRLALAGLAVVEQRQWQALTALLLYSMQFLLLAVAVVLVQI